MAIIKPAAITKIIQDVRRPLKDGTYPIKIRITFQRKQVYYRTPYSLSNIDFSEVMGKESTHGENKGSRIKKTKKEIKEISLELHEYENKAGNIIKELQVFTWTIFEKKFLTNTIANNTIKTSFEQYAKKLRENEQLGTADTYEAAMKSIDKFEPNLKFSDVTIDFLKKYEKWMLANGKSVTTIGFYLRNLRSIFNTAIEDGLITKELYPFGKRKFEIPTGKNIKKALSLSEIGLIYHYKDKGGSHYEKSKDYWIFSYLCNGINMKDVCLLKYGDIKGSVIIFERAKTIRTKRNAEPIRIALTKEIKYIIEKHGNKDKLPGNYIFPILTKGLTVKRQRQLILQYIHVVNDHMKEVALQLGIHDNVTTYTARHSFATILQRSGVSTSFISEALGHSNIQTTQNYLAGFEDAAKLETVKVLTAFKKIKN